MHPWHDIALTDNFPQTVPAVIEIPRHSTVKYEMDARTGNLKKERHLPSNIQWPDNYGFIPQTLGGDGDPVDIFVLSHHVFTPMTETQARPIGVMHVLDNGAADNKIIAIDTRDSAFNTYCNITDLPSEWIEALNRFFKNYKTTLQKDIACLGMGNAATARQIIADGAATYQKNKKAGLFQ